MVSELFPDLIDEVSECSQLGPTRFLGAFESVIQRYPWLTVLVGIGLGYFVARRAR